MIEMTRNEFEKLNYRTSQAIHYHVNIVEPLVQKFAGINAEIVKLERTELDELGIGSTVAAKEVSRLRNALVIYNQKFKSENGFAVKVKTRKGDLYLVKEF